MMIRNKTRVGNRTRLRKGTHRNRQLDRRSLNMEPLEDRVVLTGFTAYNGLFASDMTNANTTLYSPIGADQSGPLKDISTGVEQTASLSTLQLGVVFDATLVTGTKIHEPGEDVTGVCA